MLSRIPTSVSVRPDEAEDGCPGGEGQDDLARLTALMTLSEGHADFISDRVGVMYLGSLVEVGSGEEIFAPPFHPYTETLLAAMPTLDGSRRS